MADGGNTSDTLADQVRSIIPHDQTPPVPQPEPPNPDFQTEPPGTVPQPEPPNPDLQTEPPGTVPQPEPPNPDLQTEPPGTVPQPEPLNPDLQTEPPGTVPQPEPFSLAIPPESASAVIRRLEELEPQLETMDTIAEMFHNCPIACMSASTDEQLCWRLDVPSDIHSDAGFITNYAGMAEWAGLEVVFIKYLTRTESRHKTTDVLAKWSTSEGEPRPTLGNLQKCLCGEGGIDRPDVITDLAPAINKDAFNWEMDKVRANTDKPEEKKDDSWQLTRHDVMTGRRTYYTCCLVYADEDERTASMITNIFMAVKKDAVFFNPQFDLKFGKYVQETTAAVIEERCSGKVIFVISEYFFASPVCQFTVQFSKGIHVLVFGIPVLVFGVDVLVFGIHKLVFGLPVLVFGISVLVFGVDVLVFGIHVFVFSIPVLVFGIHVFVFGVDVLVFGVDVHVFGIHVLVFGIPVLVFGIHILLFGVDVPVFVMEVITGKETYYTACLVYADEDEGMAETINKLYRRVYPKATFFRPQFDMKRGKFELDTTATVIQKRCGGKAIFILSEYFFASVVCQFAVNFTAAVCRVAGARNLVPFHLTSKTEHVPAVLQGIDGVRWFRKNTRRYAWEKLTNSIIADSIIANDLQNAEETIRKVYEAIHRLLDSEPSTYLMDPPYDDDTPLPGEPIKL